MGRYIDFYATFDALKASFKLEIAQATQEGVQAVKDHERLQFEQYAKLYGLDPDWYGKDIVMRGEWFRITGLAPSRSKNCVRITRSDGKGFVCPPESVRAALRVGA